ncbi:hypothetical protein CEP51_014997 [Fusarium floridanum]|uniref:Uncharacterized protein n=1 Tax=Fusarium floridanum TaxID=1325733 RepID=A0A428PIB8_9HYPO|nr:hypothetical protein CEP51_014997 [Fusarium floridanum]
MTKDSFDAHQLDAEKNNDDFFADAKACPRPVTGSGQMVYWQNCTTIRVYESGKEDEPPIQRVSNQNGQGFVKKGLSLIVDGGRVKEIW